MKICKFKCRACGEVFSINWLAQSDTDIDRFIARVALGEKLNEFGPPLFRAHECSGEQTGIADLIAFEKE